MTNKECFEQMLPSIQAMPDGEAKTPNMPIDVFLQEAENTYKWCQKDREKLIAVGLDWTAVEAIPVLAGALREGESSWFSTRFTREEAQKLWNVESPKGYALRNEMVHDFLFAYRKDPDLLGRVQAIAEGSGHADMIQDLNDLSVLGKQNPAQLQAAGFDLAKLDLAAVLSKKLSDLLSSATSDRFDNDRTLVNRNKTYTMLKADVDEVRACGQYLFWRDAERLKGYTSEYLRKHRSKPDSKSKDDTQQK